MFDRNYGTLSVIIMHIVITIDGYNSYRIDSIVSTKLNRNIRNITIFYSMQS